MRHPRNSTGSMGTKRKRHHARRARRASVSNSSISVFPASSQPNLPSEEINSSTTRLRRVTADALAVLIGLTVGIVFQSFLAVSRLTFADESLSASLVIAPGLLALAIGVRFPQWLTVRICAYAWQRVIARGTSSKAAAALINPRRSDAGLNWIVLSATLLVAGLLVAAMPTGFERSAGLYWLIRDHFVWSWSTIAMLEFVVVFLVLVVPMSVLGLAASFAHRVSDEHSTWHPRATGWILLGVGLGIWIAGSGLGSIVRPNLMMMYAALLPLLGSLGAGVSQTSAPASDTSGQPDRSISIPIRSDRFPSLLRASITVVGVAGATTVAMWLGKGASTDTGVSASEVISPYLVTSAACVAMGSGVVAGCRWGQHRNRSLGRFGAACQIAGIVTAVSTMLLFSRLGDEALWRVTTLALSLFTIGATKAIGRLALLTCVASRSFAGSRVLARMLFWTALSIVALVPLSIHLLGSLGAITLMPLIYLVLGGVLLMYEPLPESLALKRGRQVTAFSVAIFAMIAWYWSIHA